MNKLKKIVIILVLLLVSIVFTSINALDSSSYIEGTLIEENALWYGITHKKTNAQTSTTQATAGVTNQLVPQIANIVEVPSSASVKMAVWSKFNEKDKWSKSSITSMASDYENQNPGWKVIAGINGDFFDTWPKGNAPYQTKGTNICEGENYKTSIYSSNYDGVSSKDTYKTIGFSNDGTANSLLSGNPDREIKLAIYNENNEIVQEFHIDSSNSAPLENQVSLYYAQWDENHLIIPLNVTTSSSKMYVVDNGERVLCNNEIDFYGKGIITSDSLTEVVLENQDFAIVSNNSVLNETLAQGDKIRVQYEFLDEFAEIKNAFTATRPFIENGNLLDPSVAIAGRTDLNGRQPRTLIGKKADGTIVLSVVDGRNAAKNMTGVCIDEMQALMSYYGCTQAHNLDGGGSTGMFVLKNGAFEVVNSPSDGSLRPVSNCILVVAQDPVINHSIVEVTPNMVVINAKLINTNNHPIKKLYVRINQEAKEVINDKVIFDNLDGNTLYVYTFEYLREDDEIIKLITQAKFYTPRYNPIYNNIQFTQEGLNLIVTPIIDDPNFATTSMYVMINNEKVFVINGTATFVGKTYSASDEIVLFYQIDLNNGETRKKITIKSPQFKTCVNMSFILMNQSDIFFNVMK